MASVATYHGVDLSLVATTARRVPALPALTGIRAVLALLVVFGHFGGGCIAAIRDHSTVLADPLARIAAWGHIGVNGFFILSGFVLAYTYLPASGGFRGSVRGFYAARVARIYPGYALGLALAVVAAIAWDAYGTPNGAVIFGQAPATTLLRQTALVQMWLPPYAVPFNPPSWTLSVEAFFYLLFPFAGVLLLRVPCRRLPLLALLCWLAAVLPSWLLASAHPGWRWVATVTAHPVARFPEFLVGVCLGRWFVLVRQQGRTLPHAGTVAALCAAGLVAGFAFGPPLPEITSETGPYDPLLALLIVALAGGAGHLARWLSAPRVVLLGEASYAIYILHWPLHLIAVATLGRAVPASGMPFFALYAAALITASVLTFRYVETPARRRLRSRRGEAIPLSCRHGLGVFQRRERGSGVPREVEHRVALCGADRLVGGRADGVPDDGLLR